MLFNINKFTCLALLSASFVVASVSDDSDDSHDSNMDMDMRSSVTTGYSSIESSNSMGISIGTPTPHIMKHMHGMPILQTDLLPLEREYWESYNITSFSTLTSHKTNSFIHILLLCLSIFLFYPICLILNNINSNYYLVSLFVHLIVTIFSDFNLLIFAKKSPDLYPNNVYSKLTVVLFLMIATHFIVSLIHYTNKWIRSNSIEITEFIPLSDFENYQDNSSNSSANSHPQRVQSPSTLIDDSLDLNYNSKDVDLEDNPQSISRKNIKINSFLIRLSEKYPIFFERSTRIISILFNFLNWPIFFMYLFIFPTGIATYFCLGKGDTVFNLLAHFIKGGVFFILGLISLARYCGAFTDLGWSWNNTYDYASTPIHRFSKFIPKGKVSMELVESSLILFYGSTNVFLEHLASKDGKWTPKDLQHVSIAFIYIGCGLCGVITEFKLSSWRYEKSLQLNTQSNSVNTSIIRGSPGYSPNPFPLITIFCTGILMSKHEQASELSTQVHTQWGSFLEFGSGIRFMSYIVMLLLQANSSTANYKNLQIKPITELIVTFCLLCGGMIFMESTDPIILGLEYRGFGSMFTLNICIGVVTLIMGWEMSLFALKDWLKKRC